MKYFTKEWYKKAQASDICFQLKSSDKAAVFSEKYFASVYSYQEKWQIKQLKRAAKAAKESFNEETAANIFRKNYEDNLALIREVFPEEVLKNVPDVRMLALGIADRNTSLEMSRYCGELARECEKAGAAYDRETEELAERIGWLKINKLNLILGTAVVFCGESDGIYVIETRALEADISYRISLSDASVTCCEADENAIVLQLELLEEEGSLRLNLLCECANGDICEFSASMKDFELEE